MVRDKTVLTYHKIYIPSIYIFYIMCVSSILIAVVLCLYSKISVVVVNIFFPVGFFFPCKNNCCIIPINWNFINSRIKNSIYVYCPVNYFKFLTKNTCLSIEFKLCFCKFFCKEIFMNISPVCKTSVSFPFLVSVFL